MEITPLTFLILTLATWRLSSLIARERGPGDFLLKLRLRLGTRFDESSVEVPTSALGELITCTWCNSIWLATVAILAYLLVPDATTLVLLPFALSGGALVVERIAYGQS